ncbi:MAG: hypothetical protein K1X61_03215 [Chitinophagales bacterium]|nr:hypothetical protein [Chitinophagales bacterium]
MVSNLTKWFLIVSMLPFNIACKSKIRANQESIEDSVKVNTLRIRQEKTVSPKSWNCFDLQYDKICCPNYWQPVKQNKCLFFTQLLDSNENSFFLVLRLDTMMYNLTLDNYLRQVNVQLNEDSVEIFKEYNVSKLLFDDKKAYYGEFTTSIADTLYLSFAMYTEVHGMIYDFTLKIPIIEKQVYREIFQDILYNYQANGNYIFSKSDELVSIEEIDMATF